MSTQTPIRLSWFTALFILIGCSSALYAEPNPLPQYDVEILVFENLRADGGEELWRATGAQAGDDSFEPNTGTTTVGMDGGRGIYPLRGPNNLQAIADAMRRSSLYRPLLHWRWRQPGWERGQAVPIQLSASGYDSGGAALSGTVSLALSRYLHLTADLRLTETDSGISMTLRETRRMRSGELHYLDHPRFGVLARITPYETPAAAAAGQ